MASVDEYGYITLDENTDTSTSANTSASANTNSVNSSSSSNNVFRTGTMASSGMFWFLTIAIAMGIQAFVQGIWGAEIVGEIFGYGYGSGIESWGTNLAVALGPWGFVICAFIGTLIYNTSLCNNGKLYGYGWHHYVLSVLMSLVCSAAWILLILIITLAIVLIVGAFVIAIICGVLSGS